jgi:hypothetical protein
MTVTFLTRAFSCLRDKSARTFAAPAVPALLLFSVLFSGQFSGQASADPNPFVGEWNVSYESVTGGTDRDAAGFFAAGGSAVMRITETTTQMTVTFQGRKEESELTTVTFRQESGNVWSICNKDGKDCVTATSESRNKAKLQQRGDNKPVMVLTRKR